MNDILVKSTYDPLQGMSTDDVIEKLENILKGTVDRAYYFGSFNTPSFNRHSDIDLILIVNTETLFADRPLKYLAVKDILPNIDILVHTPAEFEKLTQNPSPGFWKNAVRSLVRFI